MGGVRCSNLFGGVVGVDVVEEDVLVEEVGDVDGETKERTNEIESSEVTDTEKKNKENKSQADYQTVSR